MDGDCILTATRMMIRRAAIMRNSVDWSEITNASLRPEATTDGLLLYSFSYDAGGVTYTVSSGSFTGHGSNARIGEFESLLDAHPEGIVVWGIDAASTGTHGVLVVKAEDGEVYAMDSSYNMGMFPAMERFLNQLKAKDYQKRTVGLMENGSWAPAAAKLMKTQLEGMKNVTVLDTVVSIKSSLKGETPEAMVKLAEELIKL